MLFDSDNSEAISAYSVSDKIESLCHVFTKQSGRGDALDLRQFLAQVSPEHQPQLLAALIPLDIEQRWHRGESRRFQDYEQEFPEYRGQLAKFEYQAHPTKEIQLDSSLPTRRSPYQPGQHLLRFVLLRRVGRGSFGEVWQAMDTELARPVAVKIPHQSVLDKIGIEGARSEAQAAAKLKHANIVTVHDIPTDGRVIVIVSEFINGPSLKAWLKNNRPSFATTAQIVAKIAEGLYHAHDREVFHRDVKPGNVLMDEKGEPHITDFGLAKNTAATDSAIDDEHVLGTPAYMPPEQAAGRSSEVDGRSDLFSLGVMLYEMLTAELPFRGEKAELLRGIREDHPTAPRSLRKEIPRDLETICLKAMEKDPARRYASAQEMAVDLRRFLRGDAIVARPPKLPERTWRYLKKHPARVMAVAISLVAMLAAGAAVNLAQANKELLGLRSVTITTEPPGARLAIAPLDPVTGEPDESRVVFAPTRSPTQLDLAPGDYFVVVLLDDGRFHEVTRFVPDKHDLLPGPSRYSGWRSGENGDIVWYEIDIPAKDVINDMARFDAVTDLKLHVGHDDKSPQVSADVAQFYMDRHEFTGRELLALVPENGRRLKEYCATEDHAAHVHHEAAMHWAERSGTRLPWDREWVRATTAGDFEQFERDVARFADAPVASFPPAGSPAFDRIADSDGGFVWGLRSNVAEWTATYAHVALPNHVATPSPIHNGDAVRWVRGGDTEVIAGSPTVAPGHRNLQSRVAVERFRNKPGVGFRGVRSAQPHFFNTDP